METSEFTWNSMCMQMSVLHYILTRRETETLAVTEA